jgi:hypothetical protein
MPRKSTTKRSQAKKMPNKTNKKTTKRRSTAKTRRGY